MTQLARFEEEAFGLRENTPLGENPAFLVMTNQWILATNLLNGTIDFNEKENYISFWVSNIKEGVHYALLKGSELECSFTRSENRVIVLPKEVPPKRPLTAKALLESGLVGMWKGRSDIWSSGSFARRLRNLVQKRKGG